MQHFFKDIPDYTPEGSRRKTALKLGQGQGGIHLRCLPPGYSGLSFLREDSPSGKGVGISLRRGSWRGISLELEVNLEDKEAERSGIGDP